MKTSRSATRTSFTPSRPNSTDLTRRVADAMRARAERVASLPARAPSPKPTFEEIEKSERLAFFRSLSISEQKRLMAFFRGIEGGEKCEEYAVYELDLQLKSLTKGAA